MNTTQEFTKTYTKPNIEATFSNKVIGILQEISHTISREMAPIDTGRPDPKIFTKDKKPALGIAGVIKFKKFNSDLLLRLSSKHKLDQVPPFDVILTGTNEYGTLSTKKFIGCELMDSGYSVSIGDIVPEHDYTYIAKKVIPWTIIEDNKGVNKC